MPDEGGQEFEALRALWTLLTAMAAVGDERELARLTATGIPSLLRCRLSGLALQQRTGPSWSLALHEEGQPPCSDGTEAVLAELDPLFQEVIGWGDFLVTGPERESKGSLIPPSLEKLGVQCLAVAPLLTLRSQVGMLLVGRGDSGGFSRNEELALRTVERAVITSSGPQLELDDWLPKPGSAPSGERIPTLEAHERDYIVEVLEVTGWRVSGAGGAAEILGLRPTTLEARMKKLGIKRKR